MRVDRCLIGKRNIATGATAFDKSRRTVEQEPPRQMARGGLSLLPPHFPSWQRPSSAPAPPRARLAASGGSSYGEKAWPLSAQPLPRVLERAASTAAHFPAFVTMQVQRAAHSEEQLAEMQKYLATNVGRYQKEILRLRDQLGKGGGAQAQ